MRKPYLLLCWLLLASLAFAQNTASVTGYLRDSAGNPLKANAYIQPELLYCGNNSPLITGEGPMVKPIPIRPNSTTGLLEGGIYKNSVIACGNSTGNTRWKMTTYVNNVPVRSDTYNITGSTWSPNDTPVTVAPVVAAPTGDSVYARRDAGNQPFTGPIMAPRIGGRFVVDGTVYTTIQAAGLAASAAGGVVEIPAGNYNTATTIPCYSNVMYLGQKGRTTVTVTGAGVHAFSGDNVPCYVVDVAIALPGATLNTGAAIRNRATSANVTGSYLENIVITGCKYVGGCIEFLGNGDNNTAATFKVIEPKVINPRITQMYDQAPATLSSTANAVWYFGGVEKPETKGGFIDASGGKLCVALQSGVNNGNTEGVMCQNPGATGSGGTHYGYGIMDYSGSANATNVGNRFHNNFVYGSSQAGYYFQGVQPILGINYCEACDLFTNGLGGLAAGAVNFTHTTDDDRARMVGLTGFRVNGIVANSAGMEIKTGNYGRARVLVDDYVLDVGGSVAATTGISIDAQGTHGTAGSFINIGKGSIRGTQSHAVLLRTLADNDLGNISISGLQADVSGGTCVGAAAANVVGPLSITQNQCSGSGSTAFSLPKSTLLTLSHNNIKGFTSAISATADYGVVNNNIAIGSGAGFGLILTVTSGISGGAIIATGNNIEQFGTPTSLTANSGSIGGLNMIDGAQKMLWASATDNVYQMRGNDIGIEAGKKIGSGANYGDANAADGYFHPYDPSTGKTEFGNTGAFVVRMRNSQGTLDVIANGSILASSGVAAAYFQLNNGVKPTCDVDHRGWFWHVAGGAGVADTVEVCSKDGADAYAWRSLY